MVLHETYFGLKISQNKNFNYQYNSSNMNYIFKSYGIIFGPF
jgi:hypothetical protein